MSGDVQRWVSILVGAGVLAFAGWLAVSQSDRHARPAAVDAGSDAGAGPIIAVTAPTSLETGDGGSLFMPTLFDGGAMGSLPSGAPRTVRLGVVLVPFLGAEGASSSARSKRDALAYAEKVAESAKTDFKAAVTTAQKEGGAGSSEDIGPIPRNVLDSRTEVAVFSMTKGEVSAPLETPRGYWIVKRLD